MKIYVYDSTFEGLLTAIYDGFYSKTPPTYICGKNDFNIPLLLGEIIEIKTDIDKYLKVKNAITSKIDFLAFKKVYIAFLSSHEDKCMAIFNYLKTAFKLGCDVHSFLNIDIIRLIDDLNRKVNNECHKLEGFIRFNYISDKILYSSIEPDNDIVELLGEHFKKRFASEYFIIHDISREKALIYNTISYEVVEMDKDVYEDSKRYTDEYSNLWKTYFKATTIEERKNLKLQRRLMPKRYWKHIFETQQNL